ncbi:MAG TPA: PilW family protein [Steroidobacteraceae bacterium]|jgi:type IV pilus assembly protein PilW
MPTCSAQRARSQGFTLIELLISLAIALFLIGGILAVVQDTRRAASSQTQANQLQDSVRLAMTVMTDVIQTAGYYSDPLNSTAVASLSAVAPFAAAQAISGTGAFGVAAPGDAVSVRYQTANNDGILNCGGTSNTTGANEIFVNNFSVDNLGNLNCTLTTAGGTTTIPLIIATTGVNPVKVTNMQVLYGVQTNFALGNQCADRYMDATQVTATTINTVSAWNYVVSVRITLSFQNPAGGADLQFTRVIGVMNKMGVVT